MKHHSISEWLKYLEQRHEYVINYDLERVSQIANALHLTSFEIPVILVAGTNGKGSTVATLEAIYHIAGYRVAAYTSPHLFQFNERIRVNKQLIDDNSLCIAFNAIEEARQDIELTYFEMTTLAALWHFKQSPLDVIILEVGMGGRLDATNVVDADLAIITSIALDHEAYLGHDRETIGFEKAGILRQNKTLVYADDDPPESVLSQALNKSVQVYALRKAYNFVIEGDVFQATLQVASTVSGQRGKVTLDLPRPQLHPKPVLAALQAAQCLQDYLPVNTEHYMQAVSSITLQGRRQLFEEDGVKIILDIAHNPQASEALREYLIDNKVGDLHVVFGAMKDKNILHIVRPLADCTNFWYPVTLETKRSASKDMLMSVFKTIGLSCETCFTGSVNAFHEARKCARAGDTILVYGSFLMVGPILAERHLS